MIFLKNALRFVVLVINLSMSGRVVHLFRSLRKDGFRPKVNFDNSPSSDELFQDALVVQRIMEKVRLRTPIRFFSLDLSPGCIHQKRTETCGNVGKCQVLSHESDLSSTLFGLDRETDEMESESLDCAGKKTKIDMLKNPPSNTEYSGGSIWNMIYGEINKLNLPLLSRLISGVQSNISVHASERYRSIGEDKFEYSIQNFIDKFAVYDERGSNLLFTFYYVVRSMCLIGDKFEEFMNKNFDENPENEVLKSEIRSLFDSELYYSCRERYTQNEFFSESELSKLNTFFEAFMSTLGCVECEKCILHGTIKGQTLYLATKALSGKNNFQIDPLAFTTYINGLYVFSSSITAIDLFTLRVRYYLLFLIYTIIFMTSTYITIGLLKKRTSKTKAEKSD